MAKISPHPHPLPSGEREKFGYWHFGVYLITGLPARSRFGEGRCLEFGYCRIYDAAYAPNFFNFNPLANIKGSTSMAGNLPSCPL